MEYQNKTYNAGLAFDQASWMLDRYRFFDSKQNIQLFSDKTVHSSMDSEAAFHLQNKRITEVPKTEGYISGKYLEEYLKAGN